MQFLLNNKTSEWAYVFKASSITFFVAVSIFFTLLLVFEADSYREQSVIPLSFIDVVGYVIIAPLIETTFMVFIFRGLLRVTTTFWLLVVVNSLLWAGLHSLSSPLWGICVFFSFLVFSICYLTWIKTSESRAFWVTSLTHGVHNLWACLFIYIVDYSGYVFGV